MFDRELLDSQAPTIPKSTGSFLWDVCEPSNSRLKLIDFIKIYQKFEIHENGKMRNPWNFLNLSHGGYFIVDGSFCAYNLELYLCFRVFHFFGQKMGVSAISPPGTGGDLDPVANRVKVTTFVGTAVATIVAEYKKFLNSEFFHRETLKLSNI